MISISKAARLTTSAVDTAAEAVLPNISPPTLNVATPLQQRTAVDEETCGLFSSVPPNGNSFVSVTVRCPFSK